MAIRLLENFGISNTASDYVYANYSIIGGGYIADKYSNPLPAYPDQAYFGFPGLYYYPSQLTVRFDNIASRDIYFGLRMFLTPDDDFTILVGSYGHQSYGTIDLNGSGNISFTPANGSSPTWTSTANFPFNEWIYMEFYLNTVQDTGILTVQLNGDFFDTSGAMLNANPYANTVYPSSLTFTRNSGSNPLNIGFTDLYILDSTTAYFNTYLGNIRIYSLDPIEIINTQFGTNSINNVEALLGANLAINTYNYGNVANTSDTFSYESIPYNYQPSALALRSCFYKDDALNHSITPYIISNDNVIQYGNTYYPGSSPHFNLDVFSLDPASNNQFTVTSINNLNAGYILNG